MVTKVEVAPCGRLRGYACLFDKVDLGRDRIERGAFAASLRGRPPDGVRMLFQHDPARPIGRWISMVEDARGLFVEGRLASDAASAADVEALIRGGAVDGLSIGFRTVRSTREAGGVRRITRIDLHEVSVVTFPMQPGARVMQNKE